MSSFRRDAQGAAALGSARVADLLAQSGVGTPAYFYDLDAIREGARRVEAAFDAQPQLVAYAVKANSAGPVLRTLFAEGLGADVGFRRGTRARLAVGARPDRVVMSGVGKTDAEIDRAIGAGICDPGRERRGDRTERGARTSREAAGAGGPSYQSRG